MKVLPRIMMPLHIVVIVSVGLFLFAATLGMTVGMHTDEHGMMQNCPFMSGQVSVCAMGAIEHLEKWQQLFAAVFLKSVGFISLIFLLVGLAFLAVFIRAPNPSSLALALSPPVLKNKQETKLFDHLVVAFSRGILNPRLDA